MSFPLPLSMNDADAPRRGVSYFTHREILSALPISVIMSGRDDRVGAAGPCSQRAEAAPLSRSRLRVDLSAEATSAIGLVHLCGGDQSRGSAATAITPVDSPA